MRWTLTALLVSVLVGQCAQLYAYVPVPVDRHSNEGGWLASGDGAEDVDEASGDPNYNMYPHRPPRPGHDEDEGSAEPPLMGELTCVQLRDTQYLHQGSYRPQCTDTGDFAPMQCHAATGECWCVRPNGQEIPGTMTRAPRRPLCHRHDDDITRVTRIRVDGDDNDIFISESTTAYRDIRTTTVASYGGGKDDEDSEVKKHPVTDLRAFILSEPFFLAALIGGAVLILLLIILILMFIVYRMRKKDEGSYSLDEPRHSFAYTRAKDQEFFA